MALGARSTAFRIVESRWAAPVALALVAATFVRLGFTANAGAWAVVQVLLVALAAHDFATHLLPNAITLPASALAVGLRAAFERSGLGEAVLAGLIAFALFYALALVLRGGFGMGDVKLAGLLGFLLGAAVAPALLLGVFAGGISAVLLVALGRATRSTPIAYGPYLALGGAIAILAFHPPPLV